MAADERVHKKTHFGPLPEAVQTIPDIKGSSPINAAPVADLAAQVNGQEQKAQAIVYPDQKEMAFRRDIYSIHGEQVDKLCHPYSVFSAVAHTMHSSICLLVCELCASMYL